MHFSVTGAKKISSLCPANVKAVLPGMQQVEVPMTFKSGQMFMKILSPPFFGIIWHQKKETAQTAQLEFGYQKKTPTKKHKKHTPKVSPSKIKTPLLFRFPLSSFRFVVEKAPTFFRQKEWPSHVERLAFLVILHGDASEMTNANPPRPAEHEKHTETFRRETFRRKPTRKTQKRRKKKQNYMKKSVPRLSCGTSSGAAWSEGWVQWRCLGQLRNFHFQSGNWIPEVSSPCLTRLFHH